MIKIFIVVITMSLFSCSTHTGKVFQIPKNERLNLKYETKKDITYVTRDNIPLFVDTFIPIKEGTYPGVLLIHGGSWSGGSRWHMNSIARRLVKNGFSVVNMTYRFAPQHLHPAQIEDCKEAVRWMRKNASTLKLNPEKIGVFGYSAGGHLAALLGTQNQALSDENDVSSKVQAVVAGSAPLDFLRYPNSPEIITLLGTTIEKNPELFKEASPVFNVDSEDPPMFLYHGTGDKIVSLTHTMDMKEALDKAKVPNELFLVKNIGHIPLFIFDFAAVQNAIDFLSFYLKRS